MHWLKAVFSLLFTLALVILLNSKMGDIPPVGKFLDPFHGFWANAEGKQATAEKKLSISGVHSQIQILFDDLMVPHIFAQNDHDLYFAQGYVTAMHRLWQMEFQTHAAAGRISEIVGEKALELDRYSRRMGMMQAAEKSLESMMADSASKLMLEAYSAGINAYIQTLSAEDYPLEYKLLDYAPESWTPLKCALLLKQMASTLSSGSDDLRMTNILQKYGKEVVQNLFPNYPFREDPIIPSGTQLDFTPVPVPTPPQNTTTAITEGVLPPAPSPEIGSNNWAISADKSATGYPILANDPHLTLSLPSIWYQIQLVGPNVNVYGASLPGAPGVIIGFNNQVSWGVTNVGSDVLDYYQIKFKDASKNEYWHDNQWKKVTKVVEKIKLRGGETVNDTVLYTHHGPVVYSRGENVFNNQTPVDHAMRWVAHESLNETLTFYKLNRAKNYQDYVEALSYYGSPAQNFIYADVYKDIAIWPNGRFPLKWETQGKFLLDGTNPDHDWKGWIPHAHNPHVKNPPRGFVSSANQFSADTTYPYYLGWEFEMADRGIRINQRLAAMQGATADSLRMLQTDNYNLYAKTVLPQMLSYVYQDKLTNEQKKAYEKIVQWKYWNNADEIGPTVFARWWSSLNQAIWEDEFGTKDNIEMRYPNRDRTIHLILNEPQAPWIDNTQTPEKETLADVVNKSFVEAVNKLEEDFGEVSDKWAWATYKSTDIMHLARIPALSRMDVSTGGGSGIVNATTGKTGPSWRMVVALGPTVRGYGVYPGGQSGNPGSYYYDNLLETWRKGELYELVYLQKPGDANKRIVSKWRLEK
jgi:penicillin amidase